jgi:hypothetical protein
MEFGFIPREEDPMWLIAIVVAWVIAIVVFRFMTVDRAAPLERQERALAALREIAQHPQPVVRDFEPHSDMPVEHIRIVSALPAGTARPRRKPTTRRTAPAARRRTAARRSSLVEQDGPVIHIDSIARDDASPAMPIDVTPADIPPPIEIPAAPAPYAVPAIDRRVRAGLLVMVAAAVFIGLLAGTIAALERGHASAPRRAGATPPTQPVAASTTTTTVAPKIAVTAVHVATLPTGDATVSVPRAFTLTLRASGDCWVQVSDVNGRVLFSGTLHAAQTQRVAGGASLVVRLGNTPAIGLAVDGQPLDLAGVGHTATVRFAQE